MMERTNDMMERIKVANKCCQGRLVSVLEGGYRINGGIVSAFGRSVAGHVRALVDGCESRQEWSPADAAWESNFERRLLQERERKRQLRLEQQLQAMKERENQLRTAMLTEEANNALMAAAAARENGSKDDHPDTPAAAPTAAEATSVGQEPSTGAGAVEVTVAVGDGGKGEVGGDALTKEGDDNLPTKRRRFNVDYVALQKKLQEEETPRTSQVAGEARETPTPAKDE